MKGDPRFDRIFPPKQRILFTTSLMRPVTFVKRFDFPVYGVDFSVDDQVIAAGGGGANRSGVKNKLMSFAVDEKNKSFKDLAQLALSDEEDCPMSIACHPELPLFAAGINGTAQDIQQGKNPNCRLFSLEHGIEPVREISTSTQKNADEYQKVTRFSRSYLVTGFSDGKVTVLKMPDLKLAFPPLRFNNIQDIDIDRDENYMAIATAKALIIASLEDGSIVQVIDSPKLNRNTTCEFRACRYASQDRANEKLYAIVNPTSRGRGFVCAWRVYPHQARYLRRAKTASVSRKGITSFAVSPSGHVLAYASTDLTIGLIDAQTLRPLLRVPDAHGFAITSLNFSRSGEFLVSAGADNCCRMMVVPKNLDLGKWLPSG
ncbi:quinon protein alcohol dehydrogenase-like superfamily [Radiomyces spectabilis]|uniref:quinon protein alcohol dehydrogenase-like superfamily n=1 Tax=Radiomyces spectabilis TaxID=64574 RepID=UPI00221F7EF4|nr:quinon protein alcohol dehydrogenase-like superfamily [Radiomyces spectabilis]KAI8370414.1 quinon protein alcohol dehydrogenase-like superfamily [Radiomyces spectabilis]